MVIYLDNNATTKVDERVLDAMLPFLKEEYANPSSMYEFSVKSSNAIADARVKMKEFLGAKSEKEIIFTSCGSESANTAIKGALTVKNSGTIEFINGEFVVNDGGIKIAKSNLNAKKFFLLVCNIWIC